jgi:hypothetical protein
MLMVMVQQNANQQRSVHHSLTPHSHNTNYYSSLHIDFVSIHCSFIVGVKCYASICLTLPLQIREMEAVLAMGGVDKRP